jgi:hypothetical protein
VEKEHAMTKQKSFKERIRSRMEKTGESYAAARRQLVEKAETEARKRRTPKTVSAIRTRAKGVHESTGRTFDQWFKVLDKWGAKDRKHGEIARWLREEHEVAGWWAQSITGAYEQERGIRAPGQSLDDTYTANASKTVDVPVAMLFEAFRNETVRQRWLGDVELTIRTVRPGKSLTAVWEDSTRITVAFIPKGEQKSQVALAHERIPDAGQTDELKAFWRERLAWLKKLLEE